MPAGKGQRTTDGDGARHARGRARGAGQTPPGRAHALATLRRPQGAPRGSPTMNRGHEHHRSARRCKAYDGRPRRFGGVQ